MLRLIGITVALLLAAHGIAYAIDQPCPDKLVDVYLTPLRLITLPPDAPGSNSRASIQSEVHLRLPRAGLFVRMKPGENASGTDCSRQEIRGFSAQYNLISNLAQGVGLPYDQPRAGNSYIEFTATDPDEKPPSLFAPVIVDDSKNREETARKGAWRVRTIDPKLPFVVGQFCLGSDINAGQCYVFKDSPIIYHTGKVNINSGHFTIWTIETPPGPEWIKVTITDFDNYFTLLRKIANAVIVVSQ